jgi:hypothetical protein
MARKPLNLYLVKRHESTTNRDETTGAIVSASTEGDAREFATTLPGDQDRAVWYAPTTRVELIGAARPDMSGGVVFSEFDAG